MPSDTPTIRPEDEVVTLPTVARELGRARNTVWVWALRGKLPARCVAGRWIVRRVDLDAFKKAQPNKRDAKKVREWNQQERAS